LVPGPLQTGTIRAAELAAGSVDVQVEHRHRRLELRGALRAPTPQHGPLEAGCNAARRPSENAGREIHRVRGLLDPPHPPAPPRRRPTPTPHGAPFRGACGFVTTSRSPSGV